MIEVLIATGGIVWAIIFGCIAYLVGEFIWAFSCSISFHRWCYARAKIKGGPIAWRKLPLSLASKSIDMMFHRNNGSTTWSDDNGGYWKGIGDWDSGWTK